MSTPSKAWPWLLALTVSCSGGSSEADIGDGVDPALLDREATEGECGYPSAGDVGHGFETGRRLANITGLIDCEGNPVELADSYCPRTDAYGDYNRAVLVSLGAGWCAPCIDETEQLMADVYTPMHGEGVEVVQILFQDEQGLAPTKSFCAQWRDEAFEEPLAFPVTLDQTSTWATTPSPRPGARCRSTSCSTPTPTSAGDRWGRIRATSCSTSNRFGRHPTGPERRAHSASKAAIRSSISSTSNEFLIERTRRSLPTTTSRG